MIRKTIDFINISVFEKLNQVQERKSEGGELERVAQELEGFDTRLNQIIADSFKIHGPMRKECLSDC